MDAFRKLFSGPNRKIHLELNTSSAQRLGREHDSVNKLNTLLNELRQLDLTDDLRLGRIRASGGFADVYDGFLHENGKRDKRRVAVKRFRVFIGENKDYAKSIAREIRVWASLNHDNILPMIGFAIVDDFPALVSEWMGNGNVREYMERYPKYGVAKMSKGIADGLSYLHSVGIVHSDLKSDNILMASNGRPMLSDFGVSRLLVENVTVAGTTTLKGNARWMAIELIDHRSCSSSTGQHQFHTKATDVWAFGMVLYELLKRKAPYYHLATEAAVIMAIVSGEQPLIVTTDDYRQEDLFVLWQICAKCWSKNPEERPSMSELAKELMKMSLNIQISVGKLFKMESGWFTFAAFSHDRRFLATLSQDHRVWVWTIEDAKLLYPPLVGHKDNLCSVTWSYNGDYILSASKDLTIRKWVSSTGLCELCVDTKHTDDIISLAYSPDGRRFASGSRDHAVYIYDSSDGSVTLGPLIDLYGLINALVFSPDGETVVSCADCSVCVWSVQTGEKLHRIPRPSEDASFHPSGDLFVTIHGFTTGVYNARTFNAIAEDQAFHDNLPIAVQYSSDGRYIITISEQLGTMRMWDAVTGEPLGPPYDFGMFIESAEISHDGRSVAICSRGRVLTWDIQVDF